MADDAKQLAELREHVARLEAEKAELEARGMPVFDPKVATRIEKIDATLDGLMKRFDGYEAKFKEGAATVADNPLFGGLFGDLFGSKKA